MCWPLLPETLLPWRLIMVEFFLLFLVWLVVLFRWMFWGGDGWS